MTKNERLLIAIGLVVIAAAVFYETIQAPQIVPASVPQTAAVSSTSAVSGVSVDLNSAGYEELMTLHGMTDRIAKLILHDRAENGRFTSAEDIMRVDGIGRGIYEKLSPFITVK